MNMPRTFTRNLNMPRPLSRGVCPSLVVAPRAVPLPILPLLALLLISLPALAGAQQEPEPEPVASRLRTGLLALYPAQTLSVVVADVADVSPGAEITIRFLDAQDQELALVEKLVLPGEPVTADLDRDDHGGSEPRLLVRLEIVMMAEQAGAEPIVNVDRRSGDVLHHAWSCAELPAGRGGPDFSCPGGCPGARIDDLLIE